MIGLQRGGLKGDPPALTRRLAALELFQRCQIAIGKDHIQSLHPWSILEPAAFDAGLDLCGHPSIQGRKETETVLLRNGACDDVVQLFQDFVDRFGGTTLGLGHGR